MAQIDYCRGLASTYTESSYGKIKYRVKATMDRFGTVFDDKADIPITICNPSVGDVSSYIVSFIYVYCVTGTYVFAVNYMMLITSHL